MMRDFNDADRKRKKERINLPENPAKLSKDMLSKLEDVVKSSLKEGYLICPVAWKIAKDNDVPKIAVGAITDKLGIRIIDCQIGFFKVDKTPYDEADREAVEGRIITELETLAQSKRLTCAAIFELARQYNLKPLAIANEANARGLSILNCQLGCF